MKVINATTQYQYVYENGKVIKKELSKEKGIITSFLHPKHLFSITKKFDMHLSEEEMFLEMEKYIYSYPGIDINKEYKSVFLKIEQENNVIIEAVLIDTKELEKNLKDILKIYKYIDFVSPSFLGWKEYYNLTKTEPKNDIFIYFSQNEAFLTCYSGGRYLFHKSLSKLNTLSKLLEKSEEEVIEILNQKGFDISSYEDESEFYIIDKFFNEFFLKVFNIINFSSNEYQIPKFERIVFYSPFEIKDIFKQYENYWSLNGIEFKKSALKTEYDHLEYLITFFNAKHYSDDNINLSVFVKPPVFITTKAGKFFIFLIFAFILTAGYGLYKSYSLLKQQNELRILQKKFSLIKKRYETTLKAVKIYKKENALLLDKIKNVKKQINEVSLKTDILYQKSKQPLFYNILAKISKSMKKHSLKAEKISKKDNFITVIIVSNYDNTQEVTSFMNDLIGYGFKNVNSSFISNEKNSYISKVSFNYE